MRAVVVIPTYNECDNLGPLVEQIRQCVPGLHILVVDDNSPDGTGKIADEMAQRYPDTFSVLHRSGKQGLGRAYVAGFRHALARGYDVILQMDADLSHDPAYLPSLLAKLEECDLVLGSRYLNGVNVVNWDFKRLLLSKMATYYVRLVTRLPVSDATGGFKCWRRATLEAIGLDGVFSNGYLFQVEMSFKAFKLGYKIGEVSITFYERNLGRSKMDWRIIREAIWGVLKLRLQPDWFSNWKARRANSAQQQPAA